ncbi:MAG: DSD1 family PLP-dependent enzyme [Wenzhouxiangellaceae bacterium]
METPALLLDRERMAANIRRLHQHVAGLGGRLRPHGKTAKSVAVMDEVLDQHCLGLTVSTLHEAEYYFEHGVSDLLYAVGMTVNKLPRVLRLMERGARLTLLLDSLAQAEQLAAAAAQARQQLAVLIEIDCDGHRAGVSADAPELLTIANQVHQSPWLELRGLMTHAGGSYGCRDVAAIRAMARQERTAMQQAARRLSEAGLPCPVVSLGSTPTAHHVDDLSGITEVRAGVYVFHDLVMAGLGICAIDDIALSVLATIIGHQHDKQQLIIDAGWMALSRDRGTANQAIDQGYGLVANAAGEFPDDLLVTVTNQEHGIVTERNGQALDFSRWPIGAQVRILPNHACATAAMFDCYHVLDGHGGVAARWPRINGW